MKSCIGLPSVDKLDQWGYYLLCGFALFSNLTIAGGNIFLVPLVLVFFLRMASKRDDWRLALPDRRLTIALLLLICATAISALCSVDPSKVGKVVDYYGYHMLPLYAVLLMVREKERLLGIASCVAASFAINGVAILYEGIVQQNHRADGFAQPMTAAGFLSMIVPALILLCMAGKVPQKYRLLLGVLTVLGIVSLLLNGTRGAWIAVAVSCTVVGFMAVHRKKRFFFGLLIAVFVFGGIFSFSPILSGRLATIGDMQFQSNSERLLLWKSAFHMFEDHPIAGVGLSRFREEYQGGYILPEAKEPHLDHAHNNIMHMLAECGIIGVSALLIFWLTWFSYGVVSWRKMRSVAALVFLAVLLGSFLQGLTEYNLGRSFVMKVYWLLLALCLQWLRLEKASLYKGIG
jgi:O-antigen polymerase